MPKKTATIKRTGMPIPRKTVTKASAVGKIAQTVEKVEPKASEENVARIGYDLDISKVPPIIVGDESGKKQTIWDSADELEKQAICAAIQFKHDSANSDIANYFNFAESLEALFPKGDKARYARGEQAMTKMAEISGITKPTIYTVRRVNDLYGRSGWLKLEKQAHKNGIALKWTQLRTITYLIGEPKYKDIRKQLEQEIVSKPMTEAQMKNWIAEAAPDTVKKSSESARHPITILVSQIMSVCGAISKRYDSWDQLLRTVDDNFSGNDEGETQRVYSECSKGREFIIEAVDRLETVQSELTKMLKLAEAFISGENMTKDDIEAAASSVKNKLAQEDAPKTKSDSMEEALFEYDPIEDDEDDHEETDDTEIFYDEASGRYSFSDGTLLTEEQEEEFGVTYEYNGGGDDEEEGEEFDEYNDLSDE